jgi:NAD(P)-dependent dehydrogenase (short-subunit alcohol dehydrogenase family)
MAKICEGRVCIVTGAGRGIGREHARMLADQGAKLVLNDNGAHTDGTGSDPSVVQAVADEIVAAGGEAVVNTDSAASWEGAQRLVNQAVETYGDLHVLINNAGILRDRVLANMTEDEWDGVIDVHLKGTFAPSRWAAAYWREQAKGGATLDNRIINTSSASGLYGNPGQTNYGAAKAGIAAFTQIAARELGRYGVTVNAIAPGALTRMTEGLPGMGDRDEASREKMNPRWISPVVVWLASTQSKGVTGRVFQTSGSELAVVECWHVGPTASAPLDAPDVDAVVRPLLAAARPNADMGGNDRDW